MKKILVLTLSLFLLTSCYDDYVVDYDYSSVYFSKQYNTRTVLVGEKMEIEVGVCLGGVMYNEYDRPVNYVINDGLVSELDAVTGFTKSTDALVNAPFKAGTVTEVSAMPQDWYTISDESKFVIPSGDHLGKLTVEFDSEKFLNAPLDTQLPYYVLPLEITTAPSIDYLLTDKYYSFIAIVYENMLFGNYWHGGVTTVKDASGTTVDEIVYSSYRAQEEDLVWNLETVAPNKLECGKISDGNIKGGLSLELNDDNTITVGAHSASDVVVEADGESKYNAAKLLQDRVINLSYKYTIDDKTYHAVDTLYFRNRVRDGVNEWRDENPGNYKK